VKYAVCRLDYPAHNRQAPILFLLRDTTLKRNFLIGNRGEGKSDCRSFYSDHFNGHAFRCVELQERRLNMKIAVTGSTGQLGRHVVKGLLEKLPPHDVVAIARNPAKAEEPARRGAAVRVAEYGNPAALEKAFAGVQKILLISSSEVGRRFEQHRNVIDAARAAGVKHIVYTSAPRAATTALIVAPEHKATEEYLVQSGMPHTILRNNWYTENYIPQIEAARKTGTIIAAAGRGRVASASRADYAAGAVTVLLGQGHDGKVYELGGDYAWDYEELAKAISGILQKNVVYRSVDPQALVRILKSTGQSEGVAEFSAALDNNIAAGLLSEVTGQLSTLIGRPTTPLKKGLSDTLF
jgi:NAD(P)H dehydrogenase (quinone)